MQVPRSSWLMFFQVLVFNFKISSYLFRADSYKAGNHQQKAWHLWEWNCSAVSVSASQTDEHSSMGIYLAEAQKMSHTFPFASASLLCFVLLAHFLTLLCACAHMTTSPLPHLCTPLPLTIFYHLFIHSSFYFLPIFIPFSKSQPHKRSHFLFMSTIAIPCTWCFPTCGC